VEQSQDSVSAESNVDVHGSNDNNNPNNNADDNQNNNNINITYNIVSSNNVDVRPNINDGSQNVNQNPSILGKIDRFIRNFSIATKLSFLKTICKYASLLIVAVVFSMIVFWNFQTLSCGKYQNFGMCNESINSTFTSDNMQPLVEDIARFTRTYMETKNGENYCTERRKSIHARNFSNVEIFAMTEEEMRNYIKTKIASDSQSIFFKCGQNFDLDKPIDEFIKQLQQEQCRYKICYDDQTKQYKSLQRKLPKLCDMERLIDENILSFNVVILILLAGFYTYQNQLSLIPGQQ